MTNNKRRQIKKPTQLTQKITKTQKAGKCMIIFLYS